MGSLALQVGLITSNLIYVDVSAVKPDPSGRLDPAHPVFVAKIKELLSALARRGVPPPPQAPAQSPTLTGPGPAGIQVQILPAGIQVQTAASGMQVIQAA